jgi:hypothetical protein
MEMHTGIAFLLQPQAQQGSDILIIIHYRNFHVFPTLNLQINLQGTLLPLQILNNTTVCRFAVSALVFPHPSSDLFLLVVKQIYSRNFRQLLMWHIRVMQ